MLKGLFVRRNMSTSALDVRKAKEAIRKRTSDLCDIIVNGGVTKIANECEAKAIITQVLKQKITSDKVNKADNERAYELLDGIRTALSTFNLHEPMDDFLCVIHQHGGPGGIPMSQELAKECKLL